MTATGTRKLTNGSFKTVSLSASPGPKARAARTTHRARSRGRFQTSTTPKPRPSGLAYHSFCTDWFMAEDQSTVTPFSPRDEG